jgi:hypothetical protein
LQRQIVLWRIFRDGGGGVTGVRLGCLAWVFRVVCGVSSWRRAGLLVSRRCRVVGSRELRYVSVSGQWLFVRAGGRAAAAAVPGCDGCGPGCGQRGPGEHLGAGRGGRGGVPRGTSPEGWVAAFMADGTFMTSGPRTADRSVPIPGSPAGPGAVRVSAAGAGGVRSVPGTGEIHAVRKAFSRLGPGCPSASPAVPSPAGSARVILRGWKLITRPGRHRRQGRCKHCRSRSHSRARPAGGSMIRTSATAWPYRTPTGIVQASEVPGLGDGLARGWSSQRRGG